jgi:predicted nucleotidyltransferase
MNTQGLLPPHVQGVIDRFVVACRDDARISAALLVGSYARGAADAHSDIDLFLVTTDDDYDDFAADPRPFARQLGEVLFEEQFGLPETLFLILADGAEVELSFIPERRVGQLLSEPHWSLLDKKGLLAGAPAAYEPAATDTGVEALRRQLAYFWHDLSHFTTAMSRGQLWWAYGQLEALRHTCLNLVRLRHNVADAEVGAESYFKIESAVPPAELDALRATFCPQEAAAMMAAAQVIVGFYRELAQPLAEANGMAYPNDLERIMLARLASLDGAKASSA